MRRALTLAILSVVSCCPARMSAGETGEPGIDTVRDSFVAAVPDRLLRSEKGTLRWTTLFGRRRVCEPTCLAATPSGRTLVSCDRLSIRATLIPAGTELWSVGLSDDSQIASLAVSPDGKWAAFVTREGSLEARELDNGAPRWPGPVRVFGTPVAISPNAQWVVTGSPRNALTLWEGTTGAEIRRFGRHRDVVTALAFSPDGSRVLAGYADGAIVIWSTEGTVLHEYVEHDYAITAICADPRGRWFASAARGGVKVWSLSGDLLRDMSESGHFRWVTVLACDSNGRTLISGSGSQIRLSDVDSGRERASLAAHEGEIRSIALATDDVIVSAASDGVRFWDSKTGQEIRRSSPLRRSGRGRK